MPSKPGAVVLASGGMDSCVTTALAAQSFRLHMLHVNYGQRTERRELQAFHDIADHYHAKRRLVVDISHLKRIGGSSLTDASMKIEEGSPDPTRIPSTYVPFRNANLLSIAVSWAEVLGAEAVFVGAVEEDSSGYPDCRQSFFEAFQKVIETGTRNERPLRIYTPLLRMRKKDIVEKGMALHAPLRLTWSCYQREDIACGVCESCRLRLRGFEEAGFRDPIPYVSSQSFNAG